MYSALTLSRYKYCSRYTLVMWYECITQYYTCIVTISLTLIAHNIVSVDPCKYFGCELGAQTQMDDKLGRYIVNGSHESSKLQDMLDGFIKKFVLCPECDNPETELVSCA